MVGLLVQVLPGRVVRGAALIVLRDEQIIAIVEDLIKVINTVNWPTFPVCKLLVLAGRRLVLFLPGSSAGSFTLNFRLLDVIVTDRKLVTYDDVSKSDTLLGLLIRVLMLVKLRVNGAQLQVQATFKFQFVNTS